MQMCSISQIKGNIFSSDCQTLVNTVNTVGVMGAGIALEFKYRYPEMFRKYSELCKEGLLQIGKLWIYEVPSSHNKILNFPTKDHWKQPSRYEYIEKGLIKFRETYKFKAIKSAAFPLLGALNGGLEPDKVLSIMVKHLSTCDIPIEIYDYEKSCEDDLALLIEKLFLREDYNTLQNITGLSHKQIVSVKDIFITEEIKNLISLRDFPGISDTIMSKIFRVAMGLKKSNSDFKGDSTQFDMINANKVAESLKK